jgi:hypothetical protein
LFWFLFFSIFLFLFFNFCILNSNDFKPKCKFF